MDLAEKEMFCKKCEKREYNIIDGTVCSITKKKPSFKNECPDFILDLLEEKKIQNTIYSSVQEEIPVQSMSIYGSISNLLLKAILKFFKIILKIVTWIKYRKYKNHSVQ